MAISNREASSILSDLGATACTDITGFGLAGHLLEMLTKDGTEVALTLDDIPILGGSLESLDQKIFSSLHADNRAVSRYISAPQKLTLDPKYEILFDPQTSGGLLASLPPELAGICLERLLDAGHQHVSIIGTVSNTKSGLPKISIK